MILASELEALSAACSVKRTKRRRDDELGKYWRCDHPKERANVGSNGECLVCKRQYQVEYRKRHRKHALG